jgi:MtN3 and saliva related transmembrane protein
MGLIGWISATILLAAIGRQVYSQWRDRSPQGVSRWLFVGQIMASLASSFIAGY